MASDSRYHHLYDHRWRKRRAAQLAIEPLCRMCAARGRTTAASIADHVEPHKGDPVKFAGALQSLCVTCHNAIKAAFEKSGVLRGCDASGAPIDKSHHWNMSG